MTIGERDFYFYLDLLFYNRSLHRLMAIELKLGSFDAAYKGQMELYLRWLYKYERRQGEEPPIGLILCGEKNREQIELLQLDRGEISVAEYPADCPPPERCWRPSCTRPYGWQEGRWKEALLHKHANRLPPGLLQQLPVISGIVLSGSGG